MNRIIRNSLSSIMLLVLAACSLPGTVPTSTTPAVRLAVQTQNSVTTFSRAGEVITYNYVVTNTGSSPLAGPVIVADLPRVVTCPNVNTVGNGDVYLDFNESVTCTSSYTITESDFNTGSITNLATANVGGVTSNPSGVTLTRAQPSSTLRLAKAASPTTYGQIGQTINYTYTITNTGTAPLGPAQFVVNDNKLSAPLNCGPAETTLAPNQPITCTAPYLITQADMAAANLTNSATATGAGQTSAPATATITNLTAPVSATPPTPQGTTPGAPSNLTPGSTIQHQVAVGEWLIQIGRCYGATFSELRNANPQIADPDFILPSMIVTVPRIGSAGRIYGPPCITFHTVQSGDTWASLAQRYNADVAVLQRANPSGLVVGQPAKIPLNSAGSVGVTAVPATITNTAPTTTTAQRITIPTGQTSTSVNGIVNPNQTVQYVINASQGQVLALNLTATAGEVAIGVNSPTGLALKPLDGSFTWNTTITTGGDHYINIASIAGASSKQFTLQVSLTSPVTPAPATATLTNTPSTPAP
jgi:uncharacterized repeat protein (TIGR01451 family)